MIPKQGTRVGAVAHEDQNVVYVFGYGVYEGHFVLPDGVTGPVGALADAARAAEIENPRIRLDNGDVVWGCECWWGSEEEVKEKIKSRRVVTISVKKSREKYNIDRDGEIARA